MYKKKFLKQASIGVSKGILLALLFSATAVTAGGLPASLVAVAKIFEGKQGRSYKQEQIQRALRYLQSKKLIDIQRQYQKEVFFLTKLGYFRVRKLSKVFGIQKPKRWDGKWRIVIFDIPETKKSERDVFRQQLKSLGLANLQQSIWVHPYECRDQIFYLAGNMFIKPYVRYIVAEEFTGERDIQRRFAL